MQQEQKHPGPQTNGQMDPASRPVKIGAIFENKIQFEEAVLELLRQYERDKPRDIFY